MAVDAVLGLLGIARRAGKLACGEEQVSSMVESGRCRAVCLAEDAGEAMRRKAAWYNRRVPVLMLPADKQTLGNAIGMRRDCTVCAVNDIGMANAIAEKLGAADAVNQEAAARVAGKKARIDARKGKKKYRE